MVLSYNKVFKPFASMEGSSCAQQIVMNAPGMPERTNMSITTELTPVVMDIKSQFKYELDFVLWFLLRIVVTVLLGTMLLFFY